MLKVVHFQIPSELALMHHVAPFSSVFFFPFLKAFH